MVDRHSNHYSEHEPNCKDCRAEAAQGVEGHSAEECDNPYCSRHDGVWAAPQTNLSRRVPESGSGPVGE